MINKNRIILFLISFVIMALLYVESFAQIPSMKFENISVKEGLSQITVTSICQDSKGFLWLGTQDGLNRYDGNRFKIFRPNTDNNIQGISNNSIWAIYEDSETNLWFGTYYGLNRYVRETESFEKYFNDSTNENSLCNNYIRCITEEKPGVLWIGTDNGLSKFNIHENKFTNYFHDSLNEESLSYNVVNTIKVISPDKIWIGTDYGLNLFDSTTEIFTKYLSQPNKLGSISDNIILSISVSKDSILWIGTQYGGLNKFDEATGTFRFFMHDALNSESTNHNAIKVIYHDIDGKLWVGTEGGSVSIFNRGNEKFDRISLNIGSLSSFHGNTIHSIYEDRNNVLWIGTFSNGLFKFDKREMRFNHVRLFAGMHGILNEAEVYAFYEDNDGDIWIGVDGALMCFDSENRSNRKVYTLGMNKNNTIQHYFVRSVIGDGKGNIWVGIFGYGLIKLEKKTGKYNKYVLQGNDPITQASKNIRSLLFDSQETLWVGSDGGGLYIFDIEKEKFQSYYSKEHTSDKIGAKRIFKIIEDRNNNVWIASFGDGLIKYDTNKEKFTHYKNIPEDSTSLRYDYVLTVFQSKDNAIWAGTDGAGLCRLDPETDNFSHYSVKDGFLNNTIYGILEDNYQNMWLSTNKGITKFNVNDKGIDNFTSEDGLCIEYHGNSIYQNKSGKYFFGGVDGFNSFYPDDIKKDMFKPNVVLIFLKIINKEVSIGEKINERVILERSISESERIELHYDDNIFSIEFVALHYIAPLKIKYAYKLEGFDKEWRNTHAESRVATYTNLDPGKYFFKVKSTNSDGIWNEAPTVLEIVVVPPFWKTWWFKGGVILFILVGLFVGLRMRIKNIEYQKRKLEEEVKIRTKELRESNATKDKFFSIISHDLKSPFNALLGFSELLSENASFLVKEKVQKYSDQIYISAKQLYALIENLLSWSRSKSGEIKNNPEIIDLYRIASNNLAILRLNAEKKNIKLVSKIEKNTNAFADVDLVSTVVRNLMTNAIKFSESGGSVIMSSAKKNGYIEVSLEDNGVGMTEDDQKKLFREDIHYTTKGTDHEKGTGLGLILCKEFIEKCGGKIWAESEEGKGSQFKFTLPED